MVRNNTHKQLWNYDYFCYNFRSKCKVKGNGYESVDRKKVSISDLSLITIEMLIISF